MIRTRLPTPAYLDEAVWHQLGDDNNWNALDVLESNAIESAFHSGSRSLKITTKDSKQYEVDLAVSTMKPLNSRHFAVVKLKRYSNKLAVPNPLWEWDDRGVWVEFGNDEIEALNVAKPAGFPSLILYVGSGSTIWCFNIIFSTMVQVSMSNGYSNGFKRRIRMNPARINTSNASTPGTAMIADPTRSQVLTASTREQLIQQVVEKSEKATAGPEDECIVCMDGFTDYGHISSKSVEKTSSSPQSTAGISLTNSVRLSECGPHFYHEGCVTMQLRVNGRCAVCSKFYIILEGTQPKSGTMRHRSIPAGQLPLAGMPSSTGTIVIEYSFPSGMQGPEHPNPGTPYSGTQRVAFLPDNPAGREVLGLLQRAFNQRLVFTVGTSVTTGRSNTVVWNGIHHKTSPTGGVTQFGWPDDTYFERVKEELKAKGITS
eukprot:CAMPEP_0182427572 /NCGR_PEP_ID=MMETSP1167-20130531/18536_1 /TAXON_ID=2988 /ORGANISM="Mallomonas Sp, Strain CCMP3275" /LENGTH=429 /DNA_ID=CAMNT_0024609895 /DNA_START=32 /DNA_END=1321 /DNA_ORIENTATION=+